MGAASWERPGDDQDQRQGAGDAADSMASADAPPNDAMRSWLARGIHTFAIDPRRLGGRGHARRVLVEDRRSAVPTAGAWRELASALQRHTLHNALTRLSSAERQVVTLAYLEGRTNRQIAATLGVSVSTVRRRLWLALEHLDEYVRRTGTWVSSILLLGLVYMIDRFARLGRFANPVGASDWTHRLAATVAVGAVTAAGVSLWASNLHSSSPNHASPPATAHLIQSLPRSTGSSVSNALPSTRGNSTSSTGAPRPATTHVVKAAVAVSDPSDEETEQAETTSDQSGQASRSPHIVTIKEHPKRAQQTSQ